MLSHLQLSHEDFQHRFHQTLKFMTADVFNDIFEVSSHRDTHILTIHCIIFFITRSFNIEIIVSLEYITADKRNIQ